MNAPVDVLAVLDARINQAVRNWKYNGQDDGPEPPSIVAFREARAAVAALIAANRNCRPRLMHDDRQQEVVCIAPADWDRIRAALALVGGGA